MEESKGIFFVYWNIIDH